MRVKGYRMQLTVYKNFWVKTHVVQDGLDIHIHYGAGAYICGEETALLEALRVTKVNLD